VLHGDDQDNIRDLVPHLKAGAHRGFDVVISLGTPAEMDAFLLRETPLPCIHNF
jgi:hypothetical protein